MTIQTAPASATDIYRNQSVEGTVDRFQRLFNTMCAGNVGNLDDVYGSDVQFIDPFGEVDGIVGLRAYFEKVYSNVSSCHFEFSDTVFNGNQACVTWTMYLKHPRLRRGREVTVAGMSHLQVSEGRVRYHRDYFDAGELLYQNLPLLGTVIRWIRKFAS
ncbi:SnoaL-like domain-containing protein [Marinobacter daqiaonensis]|uniref:SnoaL-like domain-containing protein n=1 Tax=Marinobacter daqiaonensis TaxID=650891 RepID=A0A1I6GTU7_9GAMM|nr:nuclear transport factor 2 family protein [Marinobacter daqiaonensis]SFR45511.1 SnoaL-like domain-containing protein [Marinobacter daqiaonensis]